MTLQIRTLHHYGFRSEQWAVLLGVELVKDRPCYKVIFPDMTVDWWVIYDIPEQYEFRDAALPRLGH